MTQLLKNLSPKIFLADYWQKRPLFVQGALDGTCPNLTANELAWLATLPDVESRLIFTERLAGETHYRLENGPFTNTDLESLPAENWTLLVQDVDKHLPDFRSWFVQTDFIPGWRIDDLMVSFAAPGGSVGPHMDNYDVFLCQGEGLREWSVGTAEECQPDRKSVSLSLLKPFAALDSYVASTGDVLYLPPGVPHWGVAKDACMTYSIGMRAPTRAELAAGAARLLSPQEDEMGANQDSALKLFYADPDLEPDEANAGRIAVSTIRRIRDQDLLDPSLSDEQLAVVFGSVVTDPKAWLAPDHLSEDVAASKLDAARDFRVHGMSHIAWFVSGAIRLAFANGLAYEMPNGGAALMGELCMNRFVPAVEIEKLLTAGNGRNFLIWLLAQGVFDIDPGQE